MDYTHQKTVAGEAFHYLTVRTKEPNRFNFYS